jgi:hypothetical protein
VKLGVKFPKLAYFKVKMVMKNVPEMTTPIKMLKEANAIIQGDLL